MSFVKGLKCKECGESYEADLHYMCEECFGPLEVEYDLEGLAAGAFVGRGRRGIGKYAKLLPAIGDDLGLTIGDTPLVKAERLGKDIGIDNLYLKYEGANPSLSFKDRVVATAISKVKEFGFDVVACASTGNLANSLAFQAASQGLKCVIFVPEGKGAADIAQAAACGAIIFEVAGNYDDANRLCTEVQEDFGWGVINGNLKPYYLEGAKTIAYEIMEEMRDNPPGAIISPVGGGGLLSMLWKGLNEMKETGFLVGNLPALFAAQPSGCAPIVSAIKGGAEEIMPVKPDTGIGSIAIGDPPDGSYAIKAVRESGGSGEAVTDDEAFRMVKLLAEREGIISGGAGGVALAAAARLAGSGKIDSKRPAVVILTDRGNPERLLKGEEKVTKVEASLSTFRDLWNSQSN